MKRRRYWFRRSVLAAMSLGLASACEQRPLNVAPETPNIEWETIAEFSYKRRLTSVWGSSSNDVYVGYPKTEQNDDVFIMYPKGAVLHFDGVSWEETSLKLSEQSLHVDIWGTGPNDVYVADYRLHHFDGLVWSQQPVPADVVGGTGPNDVYAATYAAVCHFDGEGWSLLHSLGGYGDAKAIWADPTPNLVVLKSSALNIWDGAEWYEVETPSSVTDIWGTSLNNLYVVGEMSFFEPGTVLWQYDGNQFSPITVPEDTYSLYGIWGFANDDIYATGALGTVIHYDGVEWTLAERLTSKKFWDVWGSTPSNIYAAGDDEKVIQFDGTQWSSIWEDKPQEAYVAWAQSPATLAVADHLFGASVYLYRGGRWEETFTGYFSYVVALGGLSIDDLFASFWGGAIGHFDGDDWQTVANSLIGTQWSIWAASPHDVFSVGDYSIYHYDGSTWELDFETGSTFRAVWGTSADNVIAVGDGGMILRYDGAAWSEMGSGTQYPIYDVWGTSVNDVFAVGPAVILHYDGSVWRRQPAYRADLRSVAGRSPTDVIAASHSLYLHYDGFLWNRRSTRDRVIDVFGAVDGSVIRNARWNLGLYAE